jgi:hypothetical protein
MPFASVIASLILAPTVSGQNFALQYDGKQESIIPDCSALDIRDGITIECWVKPDASHPEQMFRYLVSKNYDNAGWGLLFNRDYRLHASGTGESRTTAQVGKWSHVAFSRSDKLSKLYLNGELVDSQPVQGKILPSSFQLCIGCSSFFGEPGHQLTNFAGDMDEVRIWSRARTQSQIRATMGRKLRGTERGLVVYLPLDEGRGDVAFNRTKMTAPLRLGRTYRPDEWDPTWAVGVSLKKQ